MEGRYPWLIGAEEVARRDRGYESDLYIDYI